MQDTTLDSCTDCNDLVWVHTLERVFAEDALYLFNDCWHAGHTANEHDFVNVTCLKTSVTQRFLDWLSQAINQVFDEFFQFRASQFVLKVLWTVGIRGNKWQVDFVFGRARKLFLGLFSFVLQALHSSLV